MRAEIYASSALLLALCSCAPLASANERPAPGSNGWLALAAVIDGPGGEAWITHHPGGKLVLFGRHDKKWQDHHIFMTRSVDGKWSEPQEVSFSTGLGGKSPRFSADGKSVLFVSTRPLPGGSGRETEDLNIWRSSWDGSHWGTPEPVTALNSEFDEIDALQLADGTIYFSSSRSKAANSRNPVDIYRAVPKGSGYEIAPLQSVNTDLVESTFYVTPDEAMIVFSRGDDPQGQGKDDLFLSMNRNGRWSAPAHLGVDANSPTFDYGPEISRDRQVVYLTTHRGGQAGIIAVDLKPGW